MNLRRERRNKYQKWAYAYVSSKFWNDRDVPSIIRIRRPCSQWCLMPSVEYLTLESALQLLITHKRYAGYEESMLDI